MKMNESAVIEKILRRMPVAIGLMVIVLMFVGSASASCSYSGAGDWVIESWEDCIVTDETIVLDGNLTINGNLTFKSVTLKVNANYNGSNKIEVTSTGSFKILDYNGAPSNISALNNNYRYLFWVDRGAKFLMNNSELSGVGYNYTTPDYKYMGLWINTNTSIIENSTISENYYGLTIYNVTASSNPGFKIFGTTFVLFENRNVGIFIVNTQNVWVVGNTIRAPIGGMAPVPGGGPLPGPIIFGIGIWNSNNNRIIGNSISGSPDDGINLCNADNNHIVGNDIFMNKHEGIHLYEDTNNNIISGNTIRLNDHIGICMGADHTACSGNPRAFAQTGAGRGNVITNNKIWDHKQRWDARWSADGIIVAYTTGTTISNNSIYSNKDYGIHFLNADDNDIVDNPEIRNNGLDGIILVEGSNNNEILRNKITKNKQNGVYLIDSGSNHINDNPAINENEVDGIKLESSHDNRILRNKVFKNNNHGIHLIYSCSNSIRNNSVTINRIDGIKLAYDSNNNEILDNPMINENGRHGVHFFDSTKNTIDSNTIRDNLWYGVYDHHNAVGAVCPQIHGVGNVVFPNGARCDLAPAVPWQDPHEVPGPNAPHWCLDGSTTQDQVLIDAEKVFVCRGEDIVLRVSGTPNTFYYLTVTGVHESEPPEIIDAGNVKIRSGTAVNSAQAPNLAAWIQTGSDSVAEVTIATIGASERSYTIHVYDTTFVALPVPGPATFDNDTNVAASPLTTNDDTVDITVLEKEVTFDLPNEVVICDKLTVRGTANTGTHVDVYVDDTLYDKLDELVIEDGEFSKEVITTEVGMNLRGSVRLKAWIDCDKAAGEDPPSRSPDGEDVILVSRHTLTAELPVPSVALEDDFRVLGTAKGQTEVVILSVPPKGGGGKSLLDKGQKGLSPRKASVSTTDDTYSKKMTVQEDATAGYYDIYVLSSGMDGVWSMTGEADLEAALDEICGIPSLTEGVITTKTQAEINDDILEDFVYTTGSDDLMRKLRLKVETAYVRLDPVASVNAGQPLVVTGESNRQHGYIIVVTCKGPVELAPHTVKVENDSFECVFDTTTATTGEYIVKADDGDGHTDEADVHITGAGMQEREAAVKEAEEVVKEILATPTPTPTPEPTPQPPGF